MGGGAGDQAASAVGCGIVESGIISVTLGTSGVVFAFSDKLKLDKQGRIHTFCHAVKGKWHTMGVMLSAGGSLKWFKDNLCKEELALAAKKKLDPYEIILKGLDRIAPGSERLLFLPYLCGERTPYADPYARGAFIGLEPRHNKKHMARAVLEGWTAADGRLPVNRSGGLKSKGHPIGATGISMHVLTAMQLTGTAGAMQLPKVDLGGIFNMGGAAVANYVSILERA